MKAHNYRPEIDGLRAFAVLAVIINHFSKDILPGGYLGVDIFFVISGYVITSSLHGRYSQSFRDFISGFYERRIKVGSALSVFVLIMSIGICLFNPEPQDSLETGLAALFGLSNFSLLAQSTDYLHIQPSLIFSHTWSRSRRTVYLISITRMALWVRTTGKKWISKLISVSWITVDCILHWLYTS